MREIEVEVPTTAPPYTTDAMAKNMEEIGAALEPLLDKFEAVCFSMDCSWAPEMIELARPKITIRIYTYDYWCQIWLKGARAVTLAEVLKWWEEGKDPRQEKLNRRANRGQVYEGKEAKPGAKTEKAKVGLSLEDLGL